MTKTKATKITDSMDLNKIFEYFDIQTFKSDKLITCPCPIHGGDNATGFNITISGEYKGSWFCNTRGCHEDYFGIKGLLTGILESRGKKYYPAIFKDVFGDCDLFEEDKKVLYCYQDEFVPTHETENRIDFRTKTPSDYYISRGFSPDVLTLFQVGDYLGSDRQHEMYNRCVFPVYSHEHAYMGCVGRTLTNNSAKWRNSEGFKKSQTLYGLWLTYPHIIESGTIVLVEGQGDVLKLYDSGILNCAGMFSNFLCDDHIKLLLHIGVHTIILLKDNDEAGYKGMRKIKEGVGSLFHLAVPEYETKDMGDLSITEIQEQIVPKIKEHMYE
jgi:5S rRNA maturation endonuclease (ribonuclease M5)